jgi:hypothetical protein
VVLLLTPLALIKSVGVVFLHIAIDATFHTVSNLTE